jgi:hypothetical protein
LCGKPISFLGLFNSGIRIRNSEFEVSLLTPAATCKLSKLFWHFLPQHFVCVGEWQKSFMKEIKLHNPVLGRAGGASQGWVTPTILARRESPNCHSEAIKLNRQSTRPAKADNQTK